ncbi:hypothetical protein GCM10009765_21650 [Fodinicola feengrottensis]|uniref:Uncharacterized protein n=1 Tax=Fodinicola feengrottensis TaxID=435914 RepID=A0ABN2GIN5_9ACTN
MHTDVEVARLPGLLLSARTSLVTIGHGRDESSVAAATAFVDGWLAVGGEILAVVDWPEEAASWLRPAERFVAGGPDAWVVTARPAGFAALCRRLRTTTWDPARTYRLAGLADPRSRSTGGTSRL